jgi:hypothetical protein
VLVFQTTFDVEAALVGGPWSGGVLSGGRQGPGASSLGAGSAERERREAKRASQRVGLKLEQKKNVREVSPRLVYSGPRQSEDARRFAHGGTERIFWSWILVTGGFLALAAALSVALGRSASAPLRRLIHEIEGMEASDPSSLLRMTGGGRPNYTRESEGQFARGGDLLELLISRLRVLFDDLLAERERWVEQNAERFSSIEAENQALKRERDELRAANDQALQVVSDLLAQKKKADGESTQEASSPEDSEKAAA